MRSLSDMRAFSSSGTTSAARSRTGLSSWSRQSWTVRGEVEGADPRLGPCPFRVQRVGVAVVELRADVVPVVEPGHESFLHVRSNAGPATFTCQGTTGRWPGSAAALRDRVRGGAVRG